MDMDIVEEASSDFQDWELLQPNPLPHPNTSFPEIDSGGLLEPDYFSLDARPKPYPVDLDDDKSAVSDNPSWIDPGLDENPTRYLHKDPGGFWSDSSSEPSQDRKFTDLDGRNEMDFSENASPGGIGEILEAKAEDAEGLGIFPLNSTGYERGSGDVNVSADNPHVDMVNLHGQPEVFAEEKNENVESASGGKIADVAGNNKAGHLGKRRSVVWWKMPVEILKYCVFKMSPVWAISVAAAVMGFVILGRKLYKMKKKTRGLEIKLILGDKKISQVMNRANRLNDAFSIVKRVPVIRPSLPAVGTTTAWPVVSLR